MDGNCSCSGYGDLLKKIHSKTYVDQLFVDSCHGFPDGDSDTIQHAINRALLAIKTLIQLGAWQGGSPEGYVHRTVLNALAKLERDNRRLFGRGFKGDLSRSDSSPLDAMISNEEERFRDQDLVALASELQKLPLSIQQFFTEYYFAGEKTTYRRLGEKFGMSHQRVFDALDEARQQLRSLIISRRRFDP